MSTVPDMDTLAEIAWPQDRLAEALYALARHHELPVDSLPATTSDDLSSVPRLNAWIESAAERAGLQTEQVFVALDEIEELLSKSAPALLRLAAVPDAPFLAIVGSHGRFVLTLGVDLKVHRLRNSDVQSIIRSPFEKSILPEVDSTLSRMGLSAAARVRAQARMVSDHLRNARFRGCWLVQLPPSAATAAHLRQQRLAPRLAGLAAVHAAQYALFIGSWWLIGRAVLEGMTGSSWMMGWALMLASLVPLRLMGTKLQGLTAISIGSWLRQRLLRGAFCVKRQQIRTQGSGQLFGLVTEAGAIDALALTGSVAAAFSCVEIVGASLILWMGAGLLPAVVLAAWMALTIALAWRYFRHRQLWTRERLHLSHELLDSMVGHRTRLVQEPASERHVSEDESLSRYLAAGSKMDRTELWLIAFVPRAWLVVALVSFMPLLTGTASPSRIAISIGAALLAFRAFARLTNGLAHLAGAAIAGKAVLPLTQAASLRPPAGLLAPNQSSGQRRDTQPVARVQDLTFRYRPQDEPVLRHCDLTIERDARLLLEGDSGSGKTTLGSILAGLEAPESGLVLMDGLDRAATGASGWRDRVVMAPQAHDNFIVGGSLAMNLLMGRSWPPEQADLAEAEAVCRDLGLGDLIDRLPGGLFQTIGETGWQLSQGERTRVFLARALLRQPDLLVLDESFSALDPENLERAIRSVADRSQAVLAIAHP